jgi:Protein of unknown function (DUF3168)
MILEDELETLLNPLAPDSVFPDVAPQDAPLPRIVYQQVGGRTVDFAEGSVPDRENARMQIACWARTRAEAVALSKAVEGALLPAAVIQATALGARISVYEGDTELYASLQDFSIWSPR